MIRNSYREPVWRDESKLLVGGFKTNVTPLRWEQLLLCLAYGIDAHEATREVGFSRVRFLDDTGFLHRQRSFNLSVSCSKLEPSPLHPIVPSSFPFWLSVSMSHTWTSKLGLRKELYETGKRDDEHGRGDHNERLVMSSAPKANKTTNLYHLSLLLLLHVSLHSHYLVALFHRPPCGFTILPTLVLARATRVFHTQVSEPWHRGPICLRSNWRKANCQSGRKTIANRRRKCLLRIQNPWGKKETLVWNHWVLNWTWIQKVHKAEGLVNWMT